MEKYKNTLTAALITAAIVAAIYIAGRAAGKKKGRSVKAVDTNYIDPGLNVEDLVKRLNSALWGIDWTSKKAKVLDELNDLNDSELTLIYNTYNAKYYANKPEKSLYTDIKSEWIWGSGVTVLLDRMERLELI